MKLKSNFKPDTVFELDSSYIWYSKQCIDKIKERIQIDLFDCENPKDKYLYLSDSITWLRTQLKCDKTPRTSINKAVSYLKVLITENREIGDNRIELAEMLYLHVFNEERASEPFIEFVKELNIDDLDFSDYGSSESNNDLINRYTSKAEIYNKLYLWLNIEKEKVDEGFYEKLTIDNRIDTKQDIKTIKLYFSQLLNKNNEGIQYISENKLNTILYKYFKGFSKPDEIDNSKAEITIKKYGIGKFFYDLYNKIDLDKGSNKKSKYCDILLNEFKAFENSSKKEVMNKFSSYNISNYPFTAKFSEINRE